MAYELLHHLDVRLAALGEPRSRMAQVMQVEAYYKSGSSKTWIKVKNPKAPAATRVLEGGF